MRAAAGCCCNGSMNDTTYAYDAGGAAGPGTNGSDSYGSNPYGSPAPGPQPKPKRQSDRFFSWIRGSAMERGDDRWIAGVCSAIAQRVGWSPTLVRALVLASVVLCGFGLALYAIAWALLPDARDGRILGEELIDGRWDWNMLGVIIMMMLAVAVPGAGLAAALCAALVLWALVQNANRRHGGYGSGSGVSGTGDSENGSYRRGWPASSYAYDGADTGEQAADAGTAGSSGPTAPETAGSAAESSVASVRQPFQQPAPGYGFGQPHTADRPARPPMPYQSSPYRPSAGPLPPKYERRKPAGFAIVIGMIGLMLVSSAVLMLANDNSSIESMTRVLTLWIGGVCLALGAVITVLGLMGRRSGGLIPLAWTAAFVAVCVLGVNVAYSYTVDAMQSEGGTLVNVHGVTKYGATDQQIARLQQGVRFVGTNYGDDRVSIDLTRDGVPGISPHKVTDVDGKVRQSTCPVGDLRISAYRARVILTLPQGCSFAFGKRSDGYRLVGSIGGRYTITRNQWGYDFLRLDNTFSGRSGEKPACDGGASNLDYSTIPEGGPELIINVPYSIEGKVAVRYVDDSGGCSSDDAL